MEAWRKPWAPCPSYADCGGVRGDKGFSRQTNLPPTWTSGSSLNSLSLSHLTGDHLVTLTELLH